MNRTANLFQTQRRLSAAGWKPLNLDELFSWLWYLCTGLVLGKVYVTFSFCCLFSQNTSSKQENVCPENKVTVKNRIIPAHIELLFMSESRRVALEFNRARISSKELCKGNDVLLLAEVMHILILHKCSFVHYTETLLALGLSHKNVIVNVHVPGATCICFDNVHKIFYSPFENRCSSKYLFTRVFPECEKVANTHANRVMCEYLNNRVF